LVPYWAKDASVGYKMINARAETAAEKNAFKEFAPAVQSALHRVARPWYRLRSVWIFRDKTGLAATPSLWGTIEKALADSEYFLLMASPEAAASPWVQREVDWWLANRFRQQHSDPFDGRPDRVEFEYQRYRGINREPDENLYPRYDPTTGEKLNFTLG